MLRFPTTINYNLLLLVIYKQIMETTAKKIKKHREALNYSQEFLAGQLGISQPAYAKMENGATRINIKRLMKISEILQVEPQELLEGSRTINQLHNEQAYGFVENLYQDNKEVYQKLIQQLEDENQRLLNENERLRKKIGS